MGFDGTTLKFDISELRDGINQANTLIKTNETEWRKYASSMDDWSNTAGGLTERNKSLNAQLEEQKKKVKNQSKIVEEYAEKFGEQSAQTQRQIQILNQYQTAVNRSSSEIEKNKAKIESLTASEAKAGKTTAELKKETEANITAKKNYQKAIAETEKKIDDLTKAEGDQSAEIATLRKKLAEERKALEEAGGAVEELAGKTEEAKGKTGKLSSALGEIGKVAGVAVAGIGAIAGAVGGAVAGMASLANATRDSRALFGKLENNAELAGKSFNSLTDDLKNVVSVTGDLEAGFEGMNMLSNIKGTDKEISEIANAFAGASAKFDGLKFEALAEGLQETLATGKAVGPFAELIERTGGDLEAFDNAMAGAGDEAGRTQVAMQWLADSGLGAVADSFKEANPALAEARQAEINLQIATNALGAIAEPIAGKIKAMGATFLTGLVPALEGTSQAFSDLINGVAGADKDLVYNIGYLIGSTTSTVKGWWETAKPALTTMFTEVFPMLAGKLIEEVPKLVASLTETLGQNAPTILSKITELTLSIAQTIAEAVPDIVSAGVTLLGGLVDSVFKVSQTILDNMPQIISSVVDGLGAGAENVLQGAGDLFQKIIDALPSFLENLKNNLPTIIETIVDKLGEWLPNILESAKDLFNEIVKAIPSLLVTLATELPQIITKITTTLLEKLPDILNMAKDLFGEIVKAIPTAVIELGKQLPTIITAIVDGLSSGATEIFNVGVNILKGVWNGINDTVDWLSDKIGSIFGKDGVIIGGIKKLLGIHSPSTVGAEIGDYFMQGIEDGLAGRAKTTEEVAKKAVAGVVTGATNANAGNGAKDIKGKLTDAFKNAFNGFDKTIQGFISKALEGAVSGDTSSITSGLEDVANFIVEGLQSILSSVWPGVGTIIAGVIGIIFNGIKMIIKATNDKKKQKEETDKAITYAEMLAKAQAEAYNETLRKTKKSIADEFGGDISGGVKMLINPQSQAQAVQNVVNYTQNNYSPKALSAKEIYRNNNRAINMLQQGVRV